MIENSQLSLQDSAVDLTHADTVNVFELFNALRRYACDMLTEDVDTSMDWGWATKSILQVCCRVQQLLQLPLGFLALLTRCQTFSDFSPLGKSMCFSSVGRLQPNNKSQDGGVFNLEIFSKRRSSWRSPCESGAKMKRAEVLTR